MDAVRLSTADVDIARAEVGRVFCPHRLVPEAGVKELRMRLAARKAGGFGVVDLDYGRAVRVEPGPLESFYLVRMPRAGQATVRHGAHVVQSDVRTASVLSPFEASDIRWGAGTPHRIFYASREVVEEQLGRILGRPVDRPVRFDVAMDLSTAAAQAWRRGVDFLAAELDRAGRGSLVDHPEVAATLHASLVISLLLTQRHSWTDALASPAAGAPAGRLVRRACDLMRDHHGEQLSAVDVAQALGVSLRTLQDAFRRELATTPTEYLRDVRLTAVHRVLRSAEPGTSVTAVALSHGFTHLGRFAQEYRARFGELPSRTLRH